MLHKTYLLLGKLDTMDNVPIVQAIPAAKKMDTRENVVPETTVTPILAISLTLYAYFLGSMFFAPIIPSILILIAYIAVVEAITWVTYYIIGWQWSAYSRLAIIVATIAGYAVGLGIYKTSKLLIGNTQTQ